VRKLLIFFLDGFAYSYLDKINFLDDICDQVSPLETLLSYSSGILPAMWSGTYPDENGIWNEFYLSPRKRYRSLKPYHFIPNGRIKNLLKYSFLNSFQRLGFFEETLPGIPEHIEYFFRRIPINYSTFPPVRIKGVATFDKILNSNNIPYQFRCYEHKPEKYSILKTIERGKRNTEVFIYSIDLCDSLGHKYGPEPKRFRESIERLENLIIKAYSTLSKDYDTSLVVFSDHGMTQIDKYANLEEQLQEFNLGQDFLVFLDSTIARFWFFNEAARDGILDILRNSKSGNILTSHELKRYGLDFKDDRYGELIFITKPTTIIHPNFMARPLVSQQPTYMGMHGYVPEEPSTRGIFMCNSQVDLKLGRSTHITQILNLILKVLDGNIRAKILKSRQK